MDWKSARLELPCYCITTEKRDFIFYTTCRTVSHQGGCNPTANETRLLLWHCEAPDKKHFSSRIGHVYQIWFPVEKWKCHMKVPSRKLWFRKVTLRLFFKEWVLGHVYNRRIKWLAAANCIKKSRRVEVMFAHTAKPNWVDSEHRKWRPKNSPQHPGGTLYNGLHGKSPPEMGTFFRPGRRVKSLWYFIIHSLSCNYSLYIFMGPSTLNMEPSSKT